jgi:hypothetical protein
MVNTRNNSCNG